MPHPAPAEQPRHPGTRLPHAWPQAMLSPLASSAAPGGASYPGWRRPGSPAPPPSARPHRRPRSTAGHPRPSGPALNQKAAKETWACQEGQAGGECTSSGSGLGSWPASVSSSAMLPWQLLCAHTAHAARRPALDHQQPHLCQHRACKVGVSLRPHQLLRPPHAQQQDGSP